MPWWAILLIILAVIALGLFLLYHFGQKLQDKQLAQKEQMVAAAQPASMLIIDKKMLPLKDAGLPKAVMEQTPKRYQKAKVPIVKAKIGPQIMNLICDDAIFDEVPTKGEVKAMVSGIYLVSVKSVRGKKKGAEAEEDTKKKKGWRAKMRARQVEYQRQLNEEIRAKESTKRAKTVAKTSGKKLAPANKELDKKSKERAKKITDGIK